MHMPAVAQLHCASCLSTTSRRQLLAAHTPAALQHILQVPMCGAAWELLHLPSSMLSQAAQPLAQSPVVLLVAGGSALFRASTEAGT